MEEDSFEIQTLYSMAFDAWRFQVEHFWSTSSYHVVFQLALGAGLWKIFEARHYWTASMLSVGAILFTCIWISHTERTIEHIRYAWYRLKQIERSANLSPDHQIFDGAAAWLTPRRKLPGDYRNYARVLPPTFTVAWLWMLVWSLRSLAH